MLVYQRVCLLLSQLIASPARISAVHIRTPTETRVLRSHRCPNFFDGTGGKKQELTTTSPASSHDFPLKSTQSFQSWQFSPVKACLGPDKGGARRDPRTAEIMQLSVPGNEGA